MAIIRQLSPVTINRIAAGEVVERPASAVKELVENALDAGATEITVVLEAAGKNLIMITDNGHGIARDSLSLAVERHTTSKLDEDDLVNIRNFGFRGEALPAIGSVSRMTITSRNKNEDLAWQIKVIGGEKGEITPASHPVGTTIEVRDLFFATPARLKFLKTDRTEVQNITDMIKRIALAHPKVGFTVISDDKTLLKLDAVVTDDAALERIMNVLGQEFSENSIKLEHKVDDLVIKGFTSLPTYDRGTSDASYLYINNRPVRDKLLFTAIRVAYHDFISRDRYPSIALFLEVPFELVDVNVHPAKSEVRFRDSNLVKNAVIAAIKSAILEQGHKTSSTIASDTIGMINTKPSFPMFNRPQTYSQYKPSQLTDSVFRPHQEEMQLAHNLFTPVSPEPPSMPQYVVDIDVAEENVVYPLGLAKCQLHKTYIISQTDDSIIVTDQHAAHERLLYEKLKHQLESGEIYSQRLLVPEIVEIEEAEVVRLLAISAELQKLGMLIDAYTPTSIALLATPALLGNCNPQKLLRDIVDDLREYDDNILLKELVNKVLATYACHHSIRSGREMALVEMNELLREMEATPHSGQCNHGRPTYIELKLKDIEKLFGRS